MSLAKVNICRKDLIALAGRVIEERQQKVKV